MAHETTKDYQAVLDAARRLAPADQLRLAKELMAGDHLVAFWEGWQRRLVTQGDVASEAEVDTAVAQVRAEHRCGKR